MNSQPARKGQSVCATTKVIARESRAVRASECDQVNRVRKATSLLVALVVVVTASSCPNRQSPGSNLARPIPPR